MIDLGSRDFWLPGRRQAVMFFAFVLLGLAVWAIRIPAGYYVNPPGMLLDQAFDTGVALYALLALALGFLFPRGFYLWGAAIILTHPFAAILLSAYQQSRGLRIVENGTPGWISFFVVLVMMTIATATVLTLLCTLGAATRYLRQRVSGRSRPASDPR